jgi:hypothetical protein
MPQYKQNPVFGREPVLWMAAIRSIVLLAVLFGFELSTEQITGLLISVEAILALITRSQVGPNPPGEYKDLDSLLDEE